MKKFLLCSILLFTMNVAWSQFYLSGEIRPRTELRNGYKSLNTPANNPALLVSQRTRVGFYYTNEWLKTGVGFQDVRLWGDETLISNTGVFGDDASVDLNEAWVEMKFLKYSAVKIGRQYFDYDDARLLSKRNWNQNSIVYDALLYTFVKQGWAVDAAFSVNNNKDLKFGQQYPPEKFKTLDFIHLQKQFNDFTMSGLVLITGVTKNDTSETLFIKKSFGLHTAYKANPFSGFASFYYQCGENTVGINVQAFNFNLLGTYSVDKFGLSAGISLISGNKPLATDSSATKTDRQFDLIYGARHGYYGDMDYFSNISASTAGAGLLDIFATIDYKVSPKTKAYLSYHYFSNQYKLNNKTTSTELSRSLASEVDFGFTIAFSKEVNLRGGLGVLLPNQALEVIQGVENQASSASSWTWLQLTVKPAFLFKE